MVSDGRSHGMGEGKQGVDYIAGIKEDHFIFGIAPEHGWPAGHGHPGLYGREDGRVFLAHLPSGSKLGNKGGE